MRNTKDITRLYLDGRLFYDPECFSHSGCSGVVEIQCSHLRRVQTTHSIPCLTKLAALFQKSKGAPKATTTSTSHKMPINSSWVLISGGKCSRYQFECRSNSECIAIYNACDGIPQCSDGSDEAPELGCPDAMTTIPPPPPPPPNHPSNPSEAMYNPQERTANVRFQCNTSP